MGDNNALATDEDFISPLKEGLKAAQAQLKVLNMAPSSYVRNKVWFLQPWTVERVILKHCAYVAPQKVVPGEDGDGEVMRDSEIVQADGDSVEGEGEDSDTDMTAMDASCDDGEVLRLAKDERRDAISQMLDSVELSSAQPSSCSRTQKIELVVEYMGKAIYKSTLVAELNGNPFLSKDRLTHIKKISLYFNNAEDYLSTANSTTTTFPRLGSDCGVLFMQSRTLGQSFRVIAAPKRNGCATRVGRTPVVTARVDIGTWWLGRVQKMQRRVGKTWGLCRNPVNLMAQTTAGKKVSSSPSIQVMLNWFKSAPGRNKYKYDVTDTRWIDIESVICIVALSFNSSNKVYTLRENN